MQKKRGFTIVELMIVIAIISILASIIIPKMGGGRDKSKVAACKSNLRHVYMAMELYGNDNNGNMVNTLSSWITPQYLVDGGYLKSYPRCPIGNEYALSQWPSNYNWYGYTGWSVIVCCWDGGLAGGGLHPGYAQYFPALLNGQVVNHGI